MKRFLIILLFAIIITPLYSATRYVAPSGGNNGNPGTISQPWATIAYSITQLYPGDTLFVRGGTYNITSQLRFDSARDGTSSDYIVMINYPGESPIIDCDALTAQSGIVINNRDYWVIQGLEQRNARQDGTTTATVGISINTCTNMHFNYIKVHDNGGYGMDLRMCDEIYIRGVDTYNNCDSLNSNPLYNGGKGDGNGVMNYSTGADTLTWGTYYFDKCRSWNNSDDGFGIGYQVYVYLDSCWAWGNGSPLYEQGAGRGYSTGHSFYPTPVIPHIILTNCLAIYNKGPGFYLNCNGENYTTTQAWYNCISAFNGAYGFNLNANNTNPPDYPLYINNSISYSNSLGNLTTDIDGLAPGMLIDEYNTWNGGVSVTSADFVSLDTTGISAARQADGSLPDNDCYNYFMRLALGSDLINAGTDVGLPYVSVAPDIGAFEFGSGEPSTETDILTFILAVQTGAATINATNHTVSIEVAYGTTVTALSPAISVSYGASIDPPGGTARNFTSPVTYTVTAEDGVTEQVWTVTVTVDSAPATSGTVVVGDDWVVLNGQIVKI